MRRPWSQRWPIVGHTQYGHHPWHNLKVPRQLKLHFQNTKFANGPLTRTRGAPLWYLINLNKKKIRASRVRRALIKKYNLGQTQYFVWFAGQGQTLVCLQGPIKLKIFESTISDWYASMGWFLFYFSIMVIFMQWKFLPFPSCVERGWKTTHEMNISVIEQQWPGRYFTFYGYGFTLVPCIIHAWNPPSLSPRL